MSLLERLRGGVLPAMATPLEADRATVHVSVVKPLVDFLIEKGVRGLFVGGSTGEGLLLSLVERERLHEATVEAVAGRVPVLIHAGTNTTMETLRLVKHGVACGADGIVVMTPSFFPMNDDDLADYFQEVAGTIPETPFLVYDIPQMAVNGVSPALLGRLMWMSNFAGMKTSRPDAQVVRQLVDVAGDKVAVFAGNERIALGSLALGATGLISGLATAIPEPFVRLTEAVAQQDLGQAQVIQRQINQILSMLPAGKRLGSIKSILTARGIPVGETVPPRAMPADKQLWAKIKTVLNK